MRLTKTYLRNRMSQKTLESLLLIATEGPARADFNFDRACDAWAARRTRRLPVERPQ